jgi:hypothetical protein
LQHTGERGIHFSLAVSVGCSREMFFSPVQIALQVEAGDWPPVTQLRRLVARAIDSLAEAGVILGRSSIDLDATLQELTNLVVPRLSDWCVIDLLDHSSLRLAAVAHSDPSKLDLVQRMIEQYGRSEDRGAARVVRTGRVELIPEITDEVLQSVAQNDEHLRMMRELGLVCIFWDVNVGSVGTVFDDTGRLRDPAVGPRVDKFLNELIWMARTLRYGRDNIPLE